MMFNTPSMHLVPYSRDSQRLTGHFRSIDKIRWIYDKGDANERKCNRVDYIHNAKPSGHDESGGQSEWISNKLSILALRRVFCRFATSARQESPFLGRP